MERMQRTQRRVGLRNGPNVTNGTDVGDATRVLSVLLLYRRYLCRLSTCRTFQYRRSVHSFLNSS